MYINHDPCNSLRTELKCVRKDKRFVTKSFKSDIVLMDLLDILNSDEPSRGLKT